MKKQQKYLSFLKIPPVENYDEKEVDEITSKGSLLLIFCINNREPLDVGSDKLTTEEVYDRVMSKDSWIFMSRPKYEKVTNKER